MTEMHLQFLVATSKEAHAHIVVGIDLGIRILGYVNYVKSICHPSRQIGPQRLTDCCLLFSTVKRIYTYYTLKNMYKTLNSDRTLKIEQNDINNKDLKVVRTHLPTKSQSGETSTINSSS